jgi:CRISPR type I-E-associated protein CasB/Cse2
MTSPTEQYIATLARLKVGDLGLLRAVADAPLDASLTGFDLFTGLWWPLRQRYVNAPRRDVAWLVAKLYAFAPTPHERGRYLAGRFAQSAPRHPEQAAKRASQVFDGVLESGLTDIEPRLQSVIGVVARARLTLDWVQLTDDLSRWEDSSVRQRWADQYLDA